MTKSGLPAFACSILPFNLSNTGLAPFPLLSGEKSVLDQFLIYVRLGGKKRFVEYDKLM